MRRDFVYNFALTHWDKMVKNMVKSDISSSIKSLSSNENKKN